MSETSAPRRVLYLVVGDPSASTIRELATLSAPETVTDVLQLTEANARETLEKIFTADTVAVWSAKMP